MKTYFHGSPFLLLKLSFENGPIHWSRSGMFLVYLLKSFLMWPGSLLEYFFVRKSTNKSEIKIAPVFLIGHYRSGTTLLHKLFSRDPQWGKINTYHFLFPYHPKWLEKIWKPILQSILKTFGARNVHFNNYKLNLDDPLEEDMITLGALTPYSAFWGEAFPKQAKKQFDKQVFFPKEEDKEDWQEHYLYLLKKVSKRNNGKPLILKNPPNTGRVKALLELFPNAKFIFIYRNPYQVYFSTFRLWKETLEKNYALQKITDDERDEVLCHLYTKIMDAYMSQKELIPKNNRAEVCYEELKKNPIYEIERLYKEVGLNGFDEAKPFIDELINKEKVYKAFPYQYDEKIQDHIYSKLGKYIDKWKYERL